MRKTLIITFLVVLNLFIFACDNATTKKNSTLTTIKKDTKVITIEKETLPDYSNNKEEILIGTWSGIPVNCTILKNDEITVGTRQWTDKEFIEQYQMMKDMGINVATCPIGYNTLDHNIRMLEAADEVGIKQLIWDTDLNYVLCNELITDDEAVMEARRLVSEYSEYESFYGNMITDEPNSSEFENLALAYKRYRMIFEDKMFYINMFPIYATSTQTGESKYETYIEKYFDVIGLDYISYDNYPLVRGQGTSTKLIENFLYNAYVCKKINPDADVWSFLLSMGYGTRKDPDCEEDFRIQSNCALAMGCNALQWFCYYSPLYGGTENFVPAVITLDGKKTDKYDYLKTVLDEIKSFQNVYTSFEWIDVMTSIGSENAKGENNAFNYFEPLKEHDRIVSYTSSIDSFMGVFKDKENRDGFMVVNYDLPSSKATNEIEIEFRNANKVICYINGTLTEVQLIDSKIKLQLHASDAAFIIPLYL